MSCHLCSNPPGLPTGPGLTQPKCWPGDQGPSRGAGAGTGPPARDSTPGPARHGLPGPQVPAQTEGGEPRAGCGSQELRGGQEPVPGAEQVCLLVELAVVATEGAWVGPEGGRPQPPGTSPAQVLSRNTPTASAYNGFLQKAAPFLRVHEESNRDPHSLMPSKGSWLSKLIPFQI